MGVRRNIEAMEDKRTSLDIDELLDLYAVGSDKVRHMLLDAVGHAMMEKLFLETKTWQDMYNKLSHAAAGTESYYAIKEAEKGVRVDADGTPYTPQPRHQYIPGRCDTCPDAHCCLRGGGENCPDVVGQKKVQLD